MTKVRQKLITLFTAVAILCLCVALFAACNGNKDNTVTFMVDGKSEVVEMNDDGSVNLPRDPEKEYYTFRGWYYDDETFEQPFDGKGAKGGETFYAYFVSVKMNLHVNGVDNGEKELKDLATLTKGYEQDALDAELTFDGWYIDAGYTTKYSAQDVDDLYARYMAEVVFDNGYESVYTVLVQSDTKLAQPKTSDIKKYYMDEEDISYVDENGKAIDFTAPISKNTTVTVLWKTPYIEYNKIDDATYYVSGFDMNKHLTELESYPCISILSENVTVETGKTADVKAVKAGTGWSRLTSVDTLLIAEGIEYISELQITDGTSMIETIRLPSTLKVLEKSLWRFTNLKSLTLPEGLEVIIDCFWRDYSSYVNNSYRDTGYDFDIEIPANVKTLISVPMNVKFADNSDYFKENNRIYKKDGANGKILVSDLWANVENDSLTVEEGVTGIAVGVLDNVCKNVTFNQAFPSYIYLPSTLSKAVYTAERSDYEAYYNGNLLTNSDYLASPSNGNMGKAAYSIFSNIDSVEYVVFNTGEYPFGGNSDNYLFIAQDGTPYDRYDGVKLVFVAEVNEGDISVTVNYRNIMDEDAAKTKTLTYATGSEITKDDLLEKLGITEEVLGVSIRVSSITQFGEDYVFGAKNCNQYIDIEYEYAAIGFTTSENSDGTLTVTGFNAEGAQLLENGTYLLVIPNYLDGKEITAIADGAFKGINSISKVYIGNSIKKIGAEAFMNTQNLEYVSVTPGGLEVIGRSAFENAGSINTDGIWKINPDMPSYKRGELVTNVAVQSLYLQIPLANLKSIEPYAFKTVALKAFAAVDGEANDRIAVNYTNMADLKENEFYFIVNASGDKTAIIQYVSTTTEKKASCLNSGEEVDVNVYDVKLIAIAGGYYNQGISSYFCLGWEIRKFAYFGDDFAFHDKTAMRYEIMEGSVYFLTQNTEICFGLVSKVHKDAFTDIGTKNSDGTITMSKTSVWQAEGDTWLDKEAVTSQSAEIFEEGWLNGKPNNENGAFDNLKDAGPGTLSY